MSTTINHLEITSISVKDIISIMNNQPAKHLAEVPFGNFNLNMDLMEDVYQSAQDAGYCRCYAAYVDDKYAGNMIIMATEMIHHRDQMQAVTDSFYISPEYRSSGIFSALIAYIEADLKANGIRFLTIGLNPNMPDFEAMKNYIEHKQYQHTEYSVTKEL